VTQIFADHNDLDPKESQILPAAARASVSFNKKLNYVDPPQKLLGISDRARKTYPMLPFSRVIETNRDFIDDSGTRKQRETHSTMKRNGARIDRGRYALHFSAAEVSYSLKEALVKLTSQPLTTASRAHSNEVYVSDVRLRLRDEAYQECQEIPLLANGETCRTEMLKE
jgi:hypothetical protein